MEELFLEVLKEHKNRYPQMEPEDYGKLIYQSEFGAKHFMADRESVLSSIEKVKPAGRRRFGGGGTDRERDLPVSSGKITFETGGGTVRGFVFENSRHMPWK